MSVFVVQLNNVGQGLLDKDPSTAAPGDLGTHFTVSKQRQVYVMGPKKINRLLKDGETFTDCNYWKKFAYPNVPHDQAFIRVYSDDGSVYSDVESENVFAFGHAFTNVDQDFNDDSTYDIVDLHGGGAHFLQIQNNNGSGTLTVELNGDTDVYFTLAAGESQVFNSGDLVITKVRLKASADNKTALMIGSVRSVINS